MKRISLILVALCVLALLSASAMAGQWGRGYSYGGYGRHGGYGYHYGASTPWSRYGSPRGRVDSGVYHGYMTYGGRNGHGHYYDGQYQYGHGYGNVGGRGGCH